MDFNEGELSGMTAAAMTAFILAAADGRLEVSFWEAGSRDVVRDGFEADVLTNGRIAVLHVRLPTLELECVAAAENAAKMKLGAFSLPLAPKGHTNPLLQATARYCAASTRMRRRGALAR